MIFSYKQFNHHRQLAGFYPFCNGRSLLIKEFASTVRTLHTNIFHIEFHRFFTNPTTIPAHLSSLSGTGSSIISDDASSPRMIFST